MSTASEIDRRAQALALSELSVRPVQHRVLARDCLSPTTEAESIQVHLRAAELYEALIKAAPGVWNDRDELINAAHAAVDTEEGL